jgi:hypothetical protein
MLKAKMNGFLLSMIFQVPSGESPDCTGQWPVPPSAGFSHRLFTPLHREMVPGLAKIHPEIYFENCSKPTIR